MNGRLEAPAEGAALAAMSLGAGPQALLLGALLLTLGLLLVLRRTRWPLGIAFCAWGILVLGSRGGPFLGRTVPLVLALLALAGAIRTAWRKDGRPPGAVGTALLCLVLGAGLLAEPYLRGFRAPPRPPAGEESPRPETETLLFRRYNFRFVPPGLPWVSLDPGKLGDDSLVYLMRATPPFYLTVRAEVEDGQDPARVEAVAEIVKGRLRSAARSFRLLEEVPKEVHGLPGMRILAELEAGGGRFTRAVWVYSHLGYTYEVSTWAPLPKVSREDLLAEAEKDLGGFEVLDRERVASPLEGDVPRFHSRLYGYDVLPPGRGWTEWKGVARDVPGAEFGLLSDEEGSLAVLPVPLFGGDPDLPILSRSLLGQLDISYPTAGLGECRAVSLGTVTGCDYDYERTADGVRSVYRLRILKGHGSGFLVASWMPKRRATARRMEDALGLVRFQEDAPRSPSLDGLPPDERPPSGRIFNEMGLAYYEAARYDEALKAFQLACTLDPTDAVLLENAVETFSALGRYKEALEYLDRRIRGFPHATSLRDWRDYLKDQVDQDKETSPGNKSAALRKSSLPQPG